MVTIKRFDLLGNELGLFEIDADLLSSRTHLQMVKDYIVAFRANQRQWNANTKTRAEVNHSGQKPRPQKGSGRARQGYLGSTQYRGGGRPKGPKTKFDQHVSMNKREKRSVVNHLWKEKIQRDSLIVLEKELFSSPRTQKVGRFLHSLQLYGRKVLFVDGSGSHISDPLFCKSLSNIPEVRYLLFPNVNGYDLLAHRMVILVNSAENCLIDLLRRGNG